MLEPTATAATVLSLNHPSLTDKGSLTEPSCEADTSIAPSNADSTTPNDVEREGNSERAFKTIPRYNVADTCEHEWELFKPAGHGYFCYKCGVVAASR